ncbi:MAG: hypothetical protein EOP56_08235 [Sphingobacteriales bacterium]|nr:MAG: hypothetical protein EOP56_08235 [Sphingobacteriales bacterium]
MKDQIANEEIVARAQELSTLYKVKVHPFVFVEPETQEQIIGYIKEPSRVVKVYAMDKMVLQPATAGMDLLEACLLKAESDPRIYSEAPEYDKFYLGAVSFATNMVTLSQNQLKKK